MEKPKLKTPTEEQLSEIARKCFDEIEFMDDDKEYNEDSIPKYNNSIYEAAMEAFYGEDVWDWINNRRE